MVTVPQVEVITVPESLEIQLKRTASGDITCGILKDDNSIEKKVSIPNIVGRTLRFPKEWVGYRVLLFYYAEVDVTIVHHNCEDYEIPEIYEYYFEKEDDDPIYVRIPCHTPFYQMETLTEIAKECGYVLKYLSCIGSEETILWSSWYDEEDKKWKKGENE